MMALVLVAGAALIAGCLAILGWALALAAANADWMMAEQLREQPEPPDLLAIYDALHREAEQITREAAQ